MPVGYCTGIKKPPNSTIFAPSATCDSYKGVFFSIIDSSTSYYEAAAGLACLPHGLQKMGIKKAQNFD